MAQACSSYPSTTLRVVPLPRLRLGRQFAHQMFTVGA
jgi:hypothetical protein